MRACPSFVAAEVSFVLTTAGGSTAGSSSARGVFCGHLGLQESRRTFGFTSACTHPDGPPPVATIELAGRLTWSAEPARPQPADS